MPREKKPRLKRRADGRYKCKYHGKQFYGATQEEAFAARDEYKAREKIGLSKDMTVADYALPWLRRTYPAVAPTTYTGLAIHLQHLIDIIGDKLISEVVPSDIKDIYTTAYRDCSTSYLKSAKQLFSSLFDAAVADGLCRSNPARDKTARPHKGTEPKTRPITEQEREWILTFCADHRAHPVVMAMLYAGLRPQEAKALKIDRDIDFKAKTITVRETAHNDPDNGQKYAFTGKGKTDKANRQIPLLPPLETILTGKKGYLITSAHGEQITHTTWRVAWNSYKAKMETAINGMPKRWYGRTKEHKALIEEGKELPPWIAFSIVPYDLRHSFCTMCRDAGVEINTCRRWMGHADAKMFLKVYDSVSENRSASEGEKLKSRLFGVQNGVQDEKEQPESIDK
ncbi:MAG: tyrosine-type recombinase/integrase [Clostridia bacterium]|nr:tyrosine-type recombinase/integrase [Clostridia bacterium]